MSRKLSTPAPLTIHSEVCEEKSTWANDWLPLQARQTLQIHQAFASDVEPSEPLYVTFWRWTKQASQRLLLTLDQASFSTVPSDVGPSELLKAGISSQMFQFHSIIFWMLQFYSDQMFQSSYVHQIIRCHQIFQFFSNFFAQQFFLILLRRDSHTLNLCIVQNRCSIVYWQ